MKYASLIMAVAIAVLSGARANAGTPSTPLPSLDNELQAAATYCTHTDGLVERRVPEYGTNDQNPLRLAGVRYFCQYTSPQDGSRIHLLIDTLYAVRPTLAALAYYAKVPAGSCQGNPASCYCSLLGGSDQFGGTNAAGGGWVLAGAIDQTLEACVFPDESSIDSFGLFYHSAGIIRGIDLGTVLRYHNKT